VILGLDEVCSCLAVSNPASGLFALTPTGVRVSSPLNPNIFLPFLLFGKTQLIVTLLAFFLLLVLGFELGTLSALGRCSILLEQPFLKEYSLCTLFSSEKKNVFMKN
jgi:hypothetical protein